MENIKNSCKNHILYIQDCSEYILKKHGEKTVNPSIKIYINKIENRIKFKIKTGYHLELLTLEKIKLFGVSKNKITKNQMVKIYIVQKSY